MDNETCGKESEMIAENAEKHDGWDVYILNVMESGHSVRRVDWPRHKRLFVNIEGCDEYGFAIGPKLLTIKEEGQSPRPATADELARQGHEWELYNPTGTTVVEELERRCVPCCEREG